VAANPFIKEALTI